MNDGQKVAWIGHEENGRTIGDEGIILVAGRQGSQVKWTSGANAGRIELVPNFDLALQGNGSHSSMLMEQPLVDLRVAATFDRRGARGLLQSLESDGHLSFFAGVKEEACTMIASRIRQDPSMIEVLSQLDPDQGDELVYEAMLSLMNEIIAEG